MAENGIVATRKEKSRRHQKKEKSRRHQKKENIGNPVKKKLDFEAAGEIGRRSSGKSEKSTGIGFRFHFRPVRKLGVEQAGGGVTPIH